MLLLGTLLKGAGKRISAVITTVAALFVVLVNAQNLGLGAWFGVHGLSFADAAARRVVVTPRSEILTAIGDTVPLAATVTDLRGATLVGTSLSWLSEDSSVASVDQTGSVVARGPGVTRVVATVKDLAAAAQITVRQRVARVAIVADSVMQVPEGDTVRLVAVALDSRGHRISERTPRWQSADTLVVAVDSTGAAIALEPGRTRLTTTVGEHTAEVVVDVILAPAALALASGEGQRAPASRVLPQPVVVRVLSRGGQPVSGVAVRFTPADGGGLAEPAAATSDDAGRAAATWTLGPLPGRQRLVASVLTIDTTLVVAAEADPVKENTRVQPVGELPVGRAGEALDQPVAVAITDTLGSTLADVPVVWTTRDGGSVEPVAPRSDSLGVAAARWTLGPKAGSQRLRIQVGNPRTMPPFTVAATVLPGPPAGITVGGGQGQRGRVGRPLPKAVVVRVRDAHGNAVPRLAVTVRPAHGTVADSEVVTDSTGQVALRWTLGEAAGPQRLEVRAAGVDSAALVSARASAGPPSAIAFRGAPGRGTGGTRVKVVVRVTDAYGNPVPGAVVVFAAKVGRLAASRGTTDASGAATTNWTLGRAAGPQAITATVRGSKVRADHTVRVTAPRRDGE